LVVLVRDYVAPIESAVFSQLISVSSTVSYPNNVLELFQKLMIISRGSVQVTFLKSDLTLADPPSLQRSASVIRDSEDDSKHRSRSTIRALSAVEQEYYQRFAKEPGAIPHSRRHYFD
jgi:hypothetical protein